MLDFTEYFLFFLIIVVATCITAVILAFSYRVVVYLLDNEF
jgi:hypothetical protein